MNSAEQKDFERIKPTTEEVGETISTLKHLLTDPDLHAHVAEGYAAAIQVLSSGQNAEVPDFKLSNAASSAIVAAAMDYLDGGCSANVLFQFADRANTLVKE